MSELQSRRRQQAQEDLGYNDAREQAQIERSMQKEERRREKKLERQIEIEDSQSYQWSQAIAKYMDKYYLDPILGFFLPGIGDILSSIFALPFIYVSLVKIRSIPLTLAVISNILIDVAIGLIPFWVGDIIDIFNRAYLKNSRLIVGFVEDDKEIIQKVNKRAFLMGLLIVIACFIIYLLIDMAISLMNAI